MCRIKRWLIFGCFCCIAYLIINYLAPNYLEARVDSQQYNTRQKEDLWNIYQKKKEELAILDKADERGFDIKEHLNLALWCMDNNLNNLAVKEFLKVVEYEPDNNIALKCLYKLNYVNYEGKWIPSSARQALVEKKIQQLLTQLKNKDKKQRQSAKDELAEIDITDKINLFTRHLNDPDEETRMYLVQSMNEINPYQVKLIVSIVPVLVKTSLEDKSENVRESAFSTATKLHKEIALHYYGESVFKSDNATRIKAIDALKRLVNSTPALSDTQKDWATYYLVVTMQKVTAIINARKVEMKGIRTIPLQFEATPPAMGLPVVTRINIDLPWTSSIGISTIIPIPTGMTVELASEQMGYIGQAMESLTDQKFGRDYNKWIAWWNERVKSKNKSEKKGD